MTISSLAKAMKRAPSKANMRKEILNGKTIEELCKTGISGMTLPEEFSVGKLVVPTFIHNLMIYIDRSGNSLGS